MGNPQPAKKKKKPVVPIVVGCVLVVLVALGATGFLALNSAKELKAQASTVLSDVNVVVDAVKASDGATASAAAKRMSETAAAMDEELSSPLWTVASLVPGVGGDVSGVKKIVSALDDVSANALVPLTASLEANPLSSLIREDKSIDLEAMSGLLDAVEEAAPVMQRTADTLDAVPAMTIPQLESMLGPAKEKVASINGLFQKAAELAPALEMLMGVDGDRSYLLAAQNSSEIRSAGGFPGSMGTLSIKDGKIELHDFSSITKVISQAEPASVQISDVERQLFGRYMGSSWDVGLDPHYPRVAEIWARTYEDQNNEHVDGVVALVPSVVQDILAVTGPITLSDGTVLDGANATKVLQYDLYWRYQSGTSGSANNSMVDLLFAEAANLAFDSLFANLNSGTLMSFAQLMLSAFDSREVMVWMTDEANQAMLEGLDCSGSLSHDPASPEVGVYFSLGVPSRLGWYLDIANDVSAPTENADGTVSYQVTTTFANIVDPADISAGGSYIMGSDDGYQPASYTVGDMTPYFYIYAPQGGTITDVRSAEADMRTAEHEGLQVAYAHQPNLKPGKTVTVTYTVTTAANPTEELKVVTTPTLTQYR